MTAIRAAAALLLVLGPAGRAAAGCPAEEAPIEPPCGFAALERMRDTFADRAAAAGVKLPSAPALREREEPGLGVWSAERGELAVPQWSALAPEERRLIARMAGSEARAPELFAWLHRWYLPACGLARAYGAGETGSRASRAAHDLAVAFLRDEPHGPERLVRLAALVEAAAARLEETEDPGARSARVELRLAQDSLRRRDALRFDEALARAHP
ncbi:MAG TPA: hypothetical protein VFP65_09575 [Anaeromyxobacteraceae bacterium]|nr:hypothetical protein [Anaeromyxobacteraceae bacterium]